MKKILTSATIIFLFFAITACDGGASESTLFAAPTNSVAISEALVPPVIEADNPESPLQVPFESPIEMPSESPLPPPLPEAVYPTVTPDPETGVLMGRIVSTYDQQPRLLTGTSVRLGTIFWNQLSTTGDSATQSPEADGIFVIEGGSSPGALTDENGIFVIADLVPGEYVMAVGDLIGLHEFLLAENGEDAKVFEVEAGAVLNVGTIEVNLP